MSVAPGPSPRPGSLLDVVDADARGALEVLDAALWDPAATREEALALLDRTAGTGTLAEVYGCRAAAIVLREREDAEDAVGHARRARQLAEVVDATLVSETECTLALCLVNAGRGDQARAAVDRAVDAAPEGGLLRARAHVQRALVHHRLGTAGWEADYAAALPVVRARGDTYWEMLARLNRGTELVYLSRHDEARADLERAIGLAEGHEHGPMIGFARHNLGFAATRAGDLPTALAAFEASTRDLAALGVDLAPAAGDRAEALLAAGFVDEAVALLDRTLDDARRTPALWPELALLSARALLATGQRAEDAWLRAEEAARTFAEQSRPGWARLAAATAALAGLAAGHVGADHAVTLARDALEADWTDVATELVAGAVGVVAGEDADRAEGLLHRLAPDTAPLGLAARLAVYEARIAVARARSDHAAVLGHAGVALADLDDHRALLGASELRANVSRHAEQVLSRAAVAALELGDLGQALGWVDRVRSQALDHPPVVPPDDAALASDLGRLRGVVDQMARDRVAGRDLTDLASRRAVLEGRVRDRTRTARGTGAVDVETGLRPAGTVEIAWLDLDGHVVALVADDRGTRRVDLDTDTAAIGAELDALGFAMQRVGRSRGPGRRRELAAASLDHSLAALDTRLVVPLDLPPDGAVVVSPTSVLFDVPWSGLPSLAARPVAVAPSLRLARRPARPDPGSGTVLLEGPRLAHARAELVALADVVTGPRAVLGPDATVAAARGLLPAAAVAHLACHGVFRADNPQFSSLELADGPMFVYDLEALPRVPELLVLSACQTGRSAVHAGDELLGVTASLLAMGARHVVAALADVPDDLSAVLMLAFHEAVAAGATPAPALASARAALLAAHDEPAARLTAAAFACIGAP